MSLKPMTLPATQSDVRVSREIEVDLEGKGDDSQQQREALIMLGVVEHTIHHRRELVRNDHFFEKSRCHHPQALGHPNIVEMMLFAKLVEEVCGPLDGTSHQLRIEHNVEGVNAEVPLGLLVPSIHLDRIAHRLKGMER